MLSASQSINGRKVTAESHLLAGARRALMTPTTVLEQKRCFRAQSTETGSPYLPPLGTLPAETHHLTEQPPGRVVWGPLLNSKQ